MGKIDSAYVEFTASTAKFDESTAKVSDKYDEIAKQFKQGLELQVKGQSKGLSGVQPLSAESSEGISKAGGMVAAAMVAGGAVAYPTIFGMMTAEIRALGKTVFKIGNKDLNVQQGILETQAGSVAKSRERTRNQRPEQLEMLGAGLRNQSQKLKANAEKSAQEFRESFGIGAMTLKQMRKYDKMVSAFQKQISRVERDAGRSEAKALGMAMAIEARYLRDEFRAKVKRFLSIAILPITIPAKILGGTFSLLTRSFRSYDAHVERASKHLGIFGVVISKATSPLTKPLSMVKNAATGATGSATRNAATIMPILATGGALIGGYALIKKALDSASELNESQNKLGEVFRSQEGNARAFIDSKSAKFGADIKDMTDLVSTFGLLFEGTGKNSEQMLSYSKQFAQVAVDATSFYNVSLKDAMNKLRSGLQGEAEPMRDFGVFLTEAAMKTKAVSMKLTDASGEVSEGNKILVRAALIAEGMSNVAGDLERTMNSPSNLLRSIQGRIANFISSIGQTLQPAYESALGAIGEVIDWLALKFKENESVFTEWANKIKFGIEVAKTMLSNLPLVWEIVRATAYAKMSNIISYLTYFKDVVKTVAVQAASNFIPLLGEMLTNAYLMFRNFFSNLIPMATYVWIGIGSTMEKVFQRMFNKLDDMTGGMVGQVMTLKSEMRIDNEWKQEMEKAKSKMQAPKGLTEGMNFDVFNRVRNSFNKIDGPKLADESAIIEKQNKLIDKAISDIDKRDGDKKKSDDAVKARVQSKPEKPEKPESDAEGQKPGFGFRPQVEVLSIEELAKKVQSSVLETPEQKDVAVKKKQTELQQQIAANTLAASIALRRQEARVSTVTTVK